ncbi:MAG: hypothetical protein O3B14_05400 [Proteobacteria bacterium]|nr:hypothetical protein [Pseudomonadota bacterium]
MKNFCIKFFLLSFLLLNLTIAANSKNQSLRIGAILPLTGDYQELGNKILKTFELTIFELSNVDVTLIPFDNNSTEAGTKFAFKELQTQKVDIVLGPIFMKNLLSIVQEENFSKYIFISLSNNNIGLPNNVISFGVNLDSQILALRSTINDKNKKKIFFADNSEFSMNVLKKIEEIKIPLSAKYKYSNFDEINKKAKMATSYNYRHKKLLDLITELKKSDNSSDQAKVKSLEKKDTLEGVSYQQVIVPLFDDDLISVVSFFDYYDVNYKDAAFVTLNQWFNQKLLLEPSLQNIIFPSINYSNFQELNKKLKENYNIEISNIEILAYDIIPLLVSSWYDKKNDFFSTDDFIGKEFRGKSGIFKINNQNYVDRKLDLYQIKNKSFVKIN